MGESEEKVAQSVQKTIQVLVQAGFSELEEVRVHPYTGSGLHRGEFPDGPGQAVPSRVEKPGTDHLCGILLQNTGIQTSTPVSETAGLMAVTLQSMEYAHLHMRPIQRYLKQHWTFSTHGLCYPVFVLVHTFNW